MVMLSIPAVFPTVASILELVGSLQVLNNENHLLMKNLVGAEGLSMIEAEEESYEFDNTLMTSFQPEHKLDGKELHKISPAAKMLRRSLSQGAPLLARQNSLMNSNSPRVFVPPADSKDRKHAKRNITVLTNRMRQQPNVTVISTPNAKPESENDTNMEPLIS